MKIFTAPQHTRFILPPIHPTKSSLRCVGGIFCGGLQRDDGAGRSTGVTVGVPESEISFKISENA